MWYMLVAANTFFFWTFLIILLGLCVVFVNNDVSGMAVLTIFTTIILATLFTDVNPFQWVLHNLDKALLYFAAYVLAGILYGYMKWVTYCFDRSKWYAANRSDIEKNYKPSAWYPDFKAYLLGEEDIPPSPSKNKWRITDWMIFWPFSGLWTCIRFPVERVWDFAYWLMSKAYAAVSTGIFNRTFGPGWDVITPDKKAD